MLPTSLVIALSLLALAAVLSQCHRDLPSRWCEERYGDEHSRFLHFNGYRVHYKLEGPERAPTVVLLHGTAASLHTFDGLSPMLQPTHRVLRYDLPGFGLTGQGDSNKYSCAADAEFLRELLARLGVERPVTLIGNSLGGRIAWEFALRYPDLTHSLVLIDSAGFPWPKKPPGLRLPRLPVIGEAFRYLTPRAFVGFNVRQVYGNPGKVTPELVQLYFELLLKEGNRRCLLDRVRVDLDNESHRIPQISCPTLVLWGEKDTWIRLHHAHRFARALPHATLITYPDLGHIPHEEEPEAAASDILAFLQSNPVP